MSSAKDRIMARLKGAPKRPASALPDWTPPAFGDQRMARFRAMLEAAHADVHEVPAAEWPERLRVILADKGVGSVLFAPKTATGARLAQAWSAGESPKLVAYDRSVEDIKDQLVHEVDAAVTLARGGIAQTGSLVLWPTPDEPRLMSLLPPIHVAVVDKSRIRDSLAETLSAEGWNTGMPTNAVLVSGPSKTADIEQTLAYGVHGPKELIVLVIEGEVE
ncbi:lactate utilization protein [Paramagnetospirillum kuznetsovii]|uniref:Lactate utilization protein n=1 Tax=Paramagnetospirillum kuznetsovii TaxID=2053833 RepID=A0A364NY20_9PROT|nr:lactate utilization protein [Paramagnetospirillum kuznetsovii]RAU21978.1 lactate utilization protein [Paramagnetospirillum kuznetsovii]